MFWYTFLVHDFGQNDWEEKTEEKNDRNAIYEVDKGPKDDGYIVEEIENHSKVEEDNSEKNSDIGKNVCEVVIERPFSTRKIMFENNGKTTEDNDKESDSGVGAESPNSVTTPENEVVDEDDDDDVQIDELFICRSKSAFSRPSLDEAVTEFGLGDKDRMVKEWVKDVKKKVSNRNVDDWWKEVAVVAFKKEGMSDEKINEFWESKRWFGGNNEVMMEMVAGKIWEMRRENERREQQRVLKTLDVEDLNNDSL